MGEVDKSNLQIDLPQDATISVCLTAILSLFELNLTYFVFLGQRFCNVG